MIGSWLEYSSPALPKVAVASKVPFLPVALPLKLQDGVTALTFGTFSNNAIHSRKHMEYHSLSKSKADRHMEPFIIDVAATDDSDFVLSSHEGEEFIMVMEGTMEISYGKNTYLLEEGDSIYYDSIVPHHVHAYEGQAAKILAVVYTPI
jgi:mannose-6-phosphate isomerase-like protein (cupin superfamily)